VIFTSRRYLPDYDRWYGHAAELDSHNYKYTGERPSWMKPRIRTSEEVAFAKTVLPHIDFGTTYEALLFDADRLNIHLGRKEFANEVTIRLQKQSNSVARGSQIIKEGTHAAQPRVEDTMIARIFDEEHIQAEMKYVKCIRANELAEDNRLDILPGGSPTSLREKSRWCSNMELHHLDRAEIGMRLNAWLPEKYRIYYVDDFQTVAANDEESRTQMKQIIANVKSEYAEEAKAAGYEKDLQEVVAELEDDVDPSRHITLDAIKGCASLDTLEGWSRVIHEYNGDDRIVAIYERAAELTKVEKHRELVAKLKTWRALVKKSP